MAEAVAPRGPAQPPSEPPAGTIWPLPRLSVPVGTRLLRLNGAAYPDPAYFGRNGLHRFDAPDGAFGVCYLGTTLERCFLEVLAQTRSAVDQPWTVAADLGLFYAAIATVEQPLDLAYLADAGLARLGIDQRHTGDDYALSQRWSAAIQAHDHLLEGIFYASRHHNGLYSVALFDRARGKVHFEAWGTLGDRGTPICGWRPRGSSAPTRSSCSESTGSYPARAMARSSRRV